MGLYVFNWPTQVQAIERTENCLIITQTYLKALNIQNAYNVYSADCLSKIKSIPSITLCNIWSFVFSTYPFLIW